MKPELLAALDECASSCNWKSWRLHSALQGNQDRSQPRDHAIIETDGRALLKVTRGAGVEQAFRNHKNLHRALPDLTAPPGHLCPTASGPVWIQPAIAAKSLESLLSNADTLPLAMLAYDRLQARLGEVETASTPDQLSAEFAEGASRFRNLEIWRKTDRTQLEAILAELKNSSREMPLRRRWSNGDLTSENILVKPGGAPLIIAAEHAQETHFYAEDFVRLSQVSPAATAHPALSAIIAPPQHPAMEMFFQLKQLWLECTQNNASYRSRIAEPRRDNILSGQFQNYEPAAPASLRCRPPETTTQLFHSVDGNWREEDSVRVNYRTDRSQLVALPVHDQSTYFRLDPSDLAAALKIRSMRAIKAKLSISDLVPGVQSANCTLSRPHPDTLIVEPSDSDPQLSLEIPDGTQWICWDVSPCQ